RNRASARRSGDVDGGTGGSLRHAPGHGSLRPRDSGWEGAGVLPPPLFFGGLRECRGASLRSLPCGPPTAVSSRRGSERPFRSEIVVEGADPRRPPRSTARRLSVRFVHVGVTPSPRRSPRCPRPVSAPCSCS